MRKRLTACLSSNFPAGIFRRLAFDTFFPALFSVQDRLILRFFSLAKRSSPQGSPSLTEDSAVLSEDAFVPLPPAQAAPLIVQEQSPPLYPRPITPREAGNPLSTPPRSALPPTPLPFAPRTRDRVAVSSARTLFGFAILLFFSGIFTPVPCSFPAW